MNYLPAPVLAALGPIYVVSTSALGRQWEVVVGIVLGIVFLSVLIGAVGWRSRRWVAVRAVGVLIALQRASARLVPGIRLPSAGTIRTRVAGFAGGLERIAADRRVLIFGVGSSTLGWILHGAVLWWSLYAVGVRIPLGASVFVVALATVTDLAPLPGGVGTVDAALVSLLVAVTNVPPPTATAASLVFRSAVLLFPIVLGGATVAVSQSNPPR